MDFSFDVEQQPKVAVVDARDDYLWVWWVSTSLSLDMGFSRKTGAWELSRSDSQFSDVLESLLFDRMVVATEAGRGAIADAGITDCRWVDLSATFAAVVEVREEYQAAFDAEQSSRTKSKQMKPLHWPTLPELLDLENPPPARGQAADADVGRCLAIAAWVDGLVRAFEDIEAVRGDRAFLRDSFAERDFPAVLA